MLEHIEYLPPKYRTEVRARVGHERIAEIERLPRAAFVDMDLFLPLAVSATEALGPDRFVEYYAEVMRDELDAAILSSAADAGFRLFGLHAFAKLLPSGFRSVAPGTGEVVVEQIADGTTARLSWVDVPPEARHPISHPLVYVGILLGIGRRFHFDLRVDVLGVDWARGRFDFSVEVLNEARVLHA